MLLAKIDNQLIYDLSYLTSIIKHAPSKIVYVINQTEEMQLIAINQSIHNWVNIRDPTEKVTMLALSKQPSIFLTIEQTDMLCKYMLDLNGENIKYFVDQSHDYCIKALTDYPWSIAYIRNVTAELRTHAVTCDPGVLKIIKEQDLSLCKLAMRLDPRTKRYIRIDYHPDPWDEFCTILHKIFFC